MEGHRLDPNLVWCVNDRFTWDWFSIYQPDGSNGPGDHSHLHQCHPQHLRSAKRFQTRSFFDCRTNDNRWSFPPTLRWSPSKISIRIGLLFGFVALSFPILVHHHLLDLEEVVVPLLWVEPSRFYGWWATLGTVRLVLRAVFGGNRWNSIFFKRFPFACLYSLFFSCSGVDDCFCSNWLSPR